MHLSAVEAATGDFRPHVFFLDGQVVFSTSVSLSLEVVRAARGESPRLDIAALDRSGGGRGLVALQVVDAGLVVTIL